MALTVEQAAAKMGMKPHREVISVLKTPDGDVVTTHDGQRTLIRPDGSMVFKVAAPARPVAARVEGEDVPELPAEFITAVDRLVEVLDNPFAALAEQSAVRTPAPTRPAKRAKVKAAE